MNQRIPVSLLTGFLGSGKTTLLGKLLRDPAMKDVAVIINEFGEVGLDHLLIERGEEEVVMLDSGCLCCTVNSSLSETLADLHFRHLRKEVTAFTRVVIETSGLADPAPILHMLLSDPSISKWYVLDGIVTTVDGSHGEAQLEAHAEATKQAAVADVLVVTKADISTAAALARLESRLERLNPGAARLRVVDGDVAAEKVVGTGLFDASRKPANVARWLATEQEHAAHGSHGHRHLDGIKTYTVVLAVPMQWSDYAAWLKRLRDFPAERLLRVKGVIALGEDRQPHVVQGVQHIFGHPSPLAQWPWDDHGSRLVFIVDGIARDALAATLPENQPSLAA